MARGSTPGGLTRRERFMRHVVAGPNGCWQWAVFIKPNGYGQFDKNKYAHRVSYEEFVGEIPEGLVVDHLCKNTRCVNPNHLEAVTQRENLRRGTGYTSRHYWEQRRAT